MVRIKTRTHTMPAFAALVLVVVAAFEFSPACAFSSLPIKPLTHHVTIGSTSTKRFVVTASATAKTTANAKSLDDLKSEILTSIEPTKRGLSTSAEQRATIEGQIRSLEAACPLTAPARDPRMGGGWEVLYTTAPPPSNGKLGPFVGVAKQAIDLQGGGYKNVLHVGGDSPWLSAVLDASWEEWDGSILIDKGGGEKWREAVVELDGGGGDENDESSSIKEAKEVSSPWEGLTDVFGGQNKDKGDSAKTPDYGATSWKVAFKTITISVFGISLLKNTFPDDTARVWKMTYLDDDTRIVRAGRTGKAEDDVVFYMVRDDSVSSNDLFCGDGFRPASGGSKLSK